MKNTLRITALLTLAGLLSGCIVVNGKGGWIAEWELEQEENRRIISELDIGTSRDAVVAQLGTPNFSEAFTSEGEEYRVLFFRTQRRHSDGDTTRNETTPLVFKDDHLIGWGDDVLASIRS